MAMRQVLKEETVDFQPKQGFRVEIPESIMLLPGGEASSEREKVKAAWEDFRSAAAPICAVRYNIWMDKTIRRNVFKTQMTNLCHHTSRRMTTLKIRFKATPRPNNNNESRNKHKENYYLSFVLLTDIPQAALDNVRHLAQISRRMLNRQRRQQQKRKRTRATRVPRVVGQYVSSFHTLVESLSQAEEFAATTIYLGNENMVVDVNNSGTTTNAQAPTMATAVVVVAATDEDNIVPTVFATLAQ